MAKEASELCISFKAEIDKVLESTDMKPAQKKSWEYLTYHCEIASQAAFIRYMRYSGASEEELEKARETFKNTAWTMEEKVHKVFDIWRLISIVKAIY